MLCRPYTPMSSILIENSLKRIQVKLTDYKGTGFYLSTFTYSIAGGDTDIPKYYEITGFRYKSGEKLSLLKQLLAAAVQKRQSPHLTLHCVKKHLGLYEGAAGPILPLLHTTLHLQQHVQQYQQPVQHHQQQTAIV